MEGDKMEKRDSGQNARTSRDMGIVNEAYIQDAPNRPRLSGLSRKYHSDTSLNEHPPEDDVFVSSTDSVVNFRVPPKDTPPRTRHLSQPGGPSSPHRPRLHIRPVRSMISMDGMVYDPLQRKFLRRNPNSDSNDPRTLLQAGGHRTLMSTNSTDSTGKISPISPNFLRNGGPLSPDVRSVGRNSEFKGAGGSTRDGISFTSVEHHTLPSTPPQERNKMFWGNLATIVSCVYAVFLVTTGLIIFVFDIFVNTPVAEIYCIYLVLAGFIYIVYLLIDLRVYINKAKRHHKEKRKHEEAYDNMMRQAEAETLDGPLAFIIPESRGGQKAPLSLDLPPPVTPLDHPYCFSQGRHAGSFYLKLGAAVFCLGHLVHSALLLSVQSVYLQSDSDCGNVVILILDIMYPIYSFCQLFFIFKYSNVIILRCKTLARFALMHCIASSICFWTWTIIRETMDSLAIYAKKKKEEKEDDDDDKRAHHFWSGINWSPQNYRQPVAMPLTSYRMPGALHLRSALNFTSYADNCSSEVGFDSIFNDLSPYLYPFTIEYSILIVGVFYILWANIGSCSKEDPANPSSEYHDKEEWASEKSSWDNEKCKLPTAVDDNGLVSNLVIHVDCHSSNKGLFTGIIIVVLTVASIIMCFITVNSGEYLDTGVLMIDVTEIILHAIMLIAVLFAYIQIKKLDVNLHPISLLDDLLLFICIPAFFMDVVLTFIPAIYYGRYLVFIKVTLITIQVLVQTPFITDALRRCSNSKQLQRLKPGRELVTFLVVCNVSTWIFETFTIKNAGIDDLRYDYYGKILWTILGHITTPLCMFYRFHSSVCLVDIWKGAYQPGNEH